MHEMSLMSNLLERAKEALCPYDVRKVNSITVQAGPLANIMPAAFEFAFETLSAGTIFDGAELKASAGIRTYEDALALIEAGAARVGTSAGVAIMEGANKV